MDYKPCTLIFTLLILSILAPAEGSICGGALQANEGTLEYLENAPDGRACVWTLRLQSKSSFLLRLNAISAETTIGIFSTEQAGSTFPVVEPRYVFNESTIDTPIFPAGDTMIIVLNPSLPELARHFSISWEGLQNTISPSVESANYLDSDEGTIIENDDGLQILAYVLNPPSGLNLNVEVKVVGFEEDCANLAYSIFEINTAGYLREVARTCGRPVALQNLRAPLIAFVAKATLQQSETISLKWDSIRIATTTTTTLPPTTTPPEDDFVISEDTCGGVVIGGAGIIRYKVNSAYNDVEKCIWTIRAKRSSTVRLNLVADGFEACCDYLTVSSLGNDTDDSVVTTVETLAAGDRRSVWVEGPIVFLVFRTDGSVVGRGFELHFEGEVAESSDSMEFNSENLWADYQFTHFHYNMSLGYNQSYQYPVASENYRNNELVTMVFNHWEALGVNSRLVISYVDIEYSTPDCYKDVLNVHQSEYSGTINHLRRLCGSHVDLTYVAPVRTSIILVFKSDSSNVGRGFLGSCRIGT